MYGASNSIDSLRSHVGSGSERHCLFADALTVAMTSVIDGGENAENGGGQPARGIADVDGQEVEVASRIELILSTMCL